ncbi:MAG: hypothetical protein Q9171_004132 [Xanthocarpia ochracea]
MSIKVPKSNTGGNDMTFSLTRVLRSTNALVVVRAQEGLLSDEGGIFGFWMDEVYGIGIGELMGRLDQLKGPIRMIHDAGMVIDDVSINNVMHDGEDMN